VRFLLQLFPGLSRPGEILTKADISCQTWDPATGKSPHRTS
jgi:hypothetical protein